MRPDPVDMARLWDMRDAARAVVEFTQDMDFEDFIKDRRTRNAVERNLEIIGEAARHISRDTRGSHPDIPWSSVIGLRNIIAHEYGEILYEKVWSICRNRLPELIARLEELDIDDAPPVEER
ncbi:MAG: DUF86 domain-containing protein [bacterium]